MKIILSSIFFFFSVVGFSKAEICCYTGDTTAIQTHSVGTICSKYKRQGLFKNLVELNNEFNPNRAYDPGCNGNISQQVDFSIQDLIIVDESIGGCDPPTIRYKLLKIENQKKYVFIVNVIQSGYCKALFPIEVSVKCEKLDPSYSFEYKIERVN